MLINALALGNPRQKEELDRWIWCAEYCPEEKITAVTGIYNEIGIDKICDEKINCVVTKDLSRLGRNYIMTGQYTELYFPSHNVRYIAIDDGVDSEKGESEIAPFKNIINEWVARDTSRKVKSAFKTKFAEGAHYGAYAPLGYKKHPDIKGKLLIDGSYFQHFRLFRL